MKRLVSLVCLAVFGAVPAAQAGLRCGSELIREGDAVAHVLLACGEPLLRQVIALDDSSQTEGVVEQWTYDLGEGRFLRIVTFEAGKVARIETGERQ